MTDPVKEVFIVGVKRAFKGSVTLPEIFQQAGITGVNFPFNDKGRFDLTADQRAALDKFSDRIHIEKPIPHF